MIKFLKAYAEPLAVYWAMLFVTELATDGTTIEMTRFLLWLAFCGPAYVFLPWWFIQRGDP